MKSIYSAGALALVVAACSGGGTNPFTTTTVGTPTTPTATASGVPIGIAGDLQSLNYDAAAQTLTVTGLSQDGVPLINSYAFVSDGQQVITASDGTTYSAYVNGYQTFTNQNDALGRHSTAFVASREGVQAGVVMTGPQFNQFFGGTFYERTGTYQAPITPEDRFDVTYHGTYAAGLNFQGPDTNILPLSPGLDPDVDVPAQSAYIRGLMFVNVDLNDMSVEGEIYNRTAVLQNTGIGPDVPGFLGLPDIMLVEGGLSEDGTFSGNLEVEGDTVTDVGDFAGLIGGPDGVTMAGGTNLEIFTPLLDNEIEYGVFVLDLCQTGDTDPVCVNATTP